jgi:hypothetical protein
MNTEGLSESAQSKGDNQSDVSGAKADDPRSNALHRKVNPLVALAARISRAWRHEDNPEGAPPAQAEIKTVEYEMQCVESNFPESDLTPQFAAKEVQKRGSAPTDAKW